MSERRRSVRRKSFLRGNISFNGGRSAVDCLIRDISDLGARVTFSDTVAIPDVVDVYIPQKEQTLRSRVLWRHGQELGVSFVDVDQVQGQTAGAGELAARVARLEAEIASIRRMLKRLKADVAGDGDVEAA
jgi:hypothetical protein